jgi:hypothetical protein
VCKAPRRDGYRSALALRRSLSLPIAFIESNGKRPFEDGIGLAIGHGCRSSGRGSASFKQQLADEGIDAAIHRPKHDFPPLKENILDFHARLLVEKDARTDPVSSADAAWIAAHFDIFNQLASTSEAFRLALEAAIDWWYAKEPRLAVGRIWTEIEAVFGVSTELVYRISTYARVFWKSEASRGRRGVRS